MFIITFEINLYVVKSDLSLKFNYLKKQTYLFYFDKSIEVNTGIFLSINNFNVLQLFKL